MKYIDADRLRKAVEKKYNSNNIVSDRWDFGYITACEQILEIIDSLQQEEPEMELEKFTEKMDTWKARHNYPDNFSIKATMAFTGRMFYMYPNVAREWYDSLPKVTLD